MDSTAARARWRRIALLAAAFLSSAAILAWLESGATIVVYNDTPRPIRHLTLQVAHTVWTVDLLESGESRRWHPPAGTAGDLFIRAADWDETGPAVVSYDPARTGNLVLRLGNFQLITTTTETAWWRKLGEW